MLERTLAFSQIKQYPNPKGGHLSLQGRDVSRVRLEIVMLKFVIVVGALTYVTVHAAVMGIHNLVPALAG